MKYFLDFLIVELTVDLHSGVSTCIFCFQPCSLPLKHYFDLGSSDLLWYDFPIFEVGEN